MKGQWGHVAELQRCEASRDRGWQLEHIHPDEGALLQLDQATKLKSPTSRMPFRCVGSRRVIRGLLSWSLPHCMGTVSARVGMALLLS